MEENDENNWDPSAVVATVLIVIGVIAAAGLVGIVFLVSSFFE